MAIPDFQSCMLPLLQAMGDGEVHSPAGLRDDVAGVFELTDRERQQLLPSGSQRMFLNRMAWAISHLKMAGLIDRKGRGQYQISDAGQRVLESPPERITVSFLKQYPEDSRRGTDNDDDHDPEQELRAWLQLTPEELVERAHDRWREQMAGELLDRVKACSPAFFEQLVLDVLVAMGYGGSRTDAAQAVGGSGDGGIDGIIKEDRLGLDRVYVQAKRWEETVSRPIVNGFVGSLAGLGAQKGVIITTSGFTKQARAYARNLSQSIILVDGPMLADLMIEYGVGVSEVGQYVVTAIDGDYFEQEQ